MALSFSTEMMRIGDLFGATHVFNMPPFQRSFCWDEETAAQLYDDIHSSMIRGKPAGGRRKNTQEYFLGPMIVTAARGSESADVIDGQQRLVVLTILLGLIRDALPMDSERKIELQNLIVRPAHHLRKFPERPRLLLLKADRECLLSWVQTPEGTMMLPKEHETESCARMLDALTHIRDEISICQPAYLEELASYILNNCYVIKITARDLNDGYVLFRSLNSRGQSLNELDLAKAELLGADPPPPGIDMEELAEQWDKAQKLLERSAFEEYMHSVLSLVAKQPQGRDLPDLMKEVLGDPLAARNFRFLLASVLRHAADLEDNTLEFGTDSKAINRIVECLEAYPITEWRSVALPWLARKPDSFKTLQFFSALDGLCLGLLILGKSKTDVMKRLRLVAKTLTIEGEAVLGRSGALRFTPQEQAQLHSLLSKPISSRKKFLKVLLLRLNAKRLPFEVPVFFPTKMTIEHILPQKPDTRGPWPSHFPDPLRRKVCTELLGNYALLTRAVNGKAKNYDFKEKRKVMFGKIDNHAIPITSDLVNYDGWTESELLRRHEILLGEALELLGIFTAPAMSQAAE